MAGDILSNLHSVPDFCNHTDTFLGQLSDGDKKSLQPDLLITFGKSLVSKNLKLFLRKYSPREHWHIQATGETADTFQSLTRTIPVTPSYFFGSLQKASILYPSSKTFKDGWVPPRRKQMSGSNRFFKKRIVENLAW
ncbi:MAG: hypothetical protein WDN75_10870 [Bacteroidota bacterium]